MRAIAGWLAFWAGFAALDIAADRRGASLCTATRRLFRTDTTAGKVALTAFLGTGHAVLHAHLLKENRR